MKLGGGEQEENESENIQLELFEAIKRIDLEKIKFILDNNVNLNLKNEIYKGNGQMFSDMTPLIYALRGQYDATDINKQEIVNFFIDNLDNDELMKQAGTPDTTWTALTMAIINENVEIAELLINKLEASHFNKYINNFDESSSVFELAINKSEGNSKLDSILELLINKEGEGFDLNIQPSLIDMGEAGRGVNKKIPLILAIEKGKIEIANLLIEKGAKVDIQAFKEIKKKISREIETVKKKYKDLKKKIFSKLSNKVKLPFFGGIKTRKIKRRKYRTKRKKSLKKKSFKKRKKTRRR